VEIARGLPVSRPAVSQHLRVLKDAGLVSGRAEGNRRVYQVETPALAELRRYLEGFWDEVLEAYRRAAEAPNEREERAAAEKVVDRRKRGAGKRPRDRKGGGK
jgi:DNA-binding transcriptional ArsR family regulator